MKVLVIPKKDLIVRDPVNKIPIPKEGKEVEYNSFWKKREKDKDVIVKKLEQKPEKKEPKNV